MSQDAVALNIGCPELISLLTCPMSLADTRRKPCVFTWNGTETRCERCGALSAEWVLRVQAALDAFDLQSGENGHSLQNLLGALATTSEADGIAKEPARAACEGCAADLPEDATFCPQCGRTATTSLRCKNCGTPWEANTQFCPKCGVKAN